MTMVDRRTSCVVGWAVTGERTTTDLQGMIDHAPQAAFYFSDLFPLYKRLVYTPGLHTPMPDKSETYLARLARKSRCFSRSLDALQRAVKCFVYLWNCRQLHRDRFPRYHRHLIDFLYP